MSVSCNNGEQMEFVQTVVDKHFLGEKKKAVRDPGAPEIFEVPFVQGQ